MDLQWITKIGLQENQTETMRTALLLIKYPTWYMLGGVLTSCSIINIDDLNESVYASSMGSDTEAADDIDRGDMAPAVMPDSYGYDIDQMTMTTKKRNATVTRTYEDMKGSRETKQGKFTVETDANMLSFLIGVVLLPSLYGEQAVNIESEKRKAVKEGWKYFKETDKFYKTFIITTSRAEAKRRCYAEEGALVTIHSRMIKEKPTNYQHFHSSNLWIGLEYVDRKWTWDDESPVNYTNWAPGEPNCLGSTGCKEYCVQINQIGLRGRYNLGQWNNYACEKKLRGFICEKHFRY
ncbi:hypothetical protein Q1695_006407 [Nippostrongylus brasiliensis]|nr:hypothetical protein Q1695_006407 [Nippostrongylus brasiliensis]